MKNRKRLTWVALGLLTASVAAGCFLLANPVKPPPPLAQPTRAAPLIQATSKRAASSTCNAHWSVGRWNIHCPNVTLEEFASALYTDSGISFKYPAELATHPVSVETPSASMEQVLDIALSAFNFVVSRTGNDNSQYASIAVVGLKGSDAPLGSLRATVASAQSSGDTPLGRIGEFFGKLADMSPFGNASTASPFGKVDSNSLQQPPAEASSPTRPTDTSSQASSPTPLADTIKAAKIAENLKTMMVETSATGNASSNRPPFSAPLAQLNKTTPPWGASQPGAIPQALLTRSPVENPNLH